MESKIDAEHQAEDTALVAAARAGDEAAFGAVTGRYRAELRVHCYRMLGSLADSEDLVQDTLLKAWRARETFEGRSTLRAWLYRIATNACLDFLSASKERRSGRTVTSAEPERGPQPHVPWLQPYPDRLLEEIAASPVAPDARLVSREALEMAYLVALQCLPAKQRAALICCEVLEWSAAEAAEALSLSVASVNAALQRARETLRDQQTSGFRPRSGAEPSAEQERELLASYVSATERCDLPALAALLREDLRFSMPPVSVRNSSRDEAIAGWVQGGFGSESFRDFRCLVTYANRMPAVALYQRRPGEDHYRPMAIDVLRIEGGLVSEITTFELAPLVAEFGLPREL